MENDLIYEQAELKAEQALCEKVSGGKVMFKNSGDEKEQHEVDSLNRALKFISEWSAETNFAKAYKQCIKYAAAAGTSLLKLNKSDKGLWAEAVRFDRKKCLFGKVERKKGTSPRSKSYTKLASETRARESYNKLKSAKANFCKIVDYYFIDMVFPVLWHNLETKEYIVESPYGKPYGSYATDEDKNKWKRLGSDFFILETDLTIELMKKIIDFKPEALFGGVISRYQTEIVPAIKAGLIAYAPNLAKECGIENINYVGMQGLLKTLMPPFTFEHRGASYYYNGETVTTNDFRKLNNIGNVGSPISMQATFSIADDLYIEIQDNAWVNENSVVIRR